MKEIDKTVTNIVFDRDTVFFAALLLRLKRLEDSTCDTAWTDGDSIGYNPEFMGKLTTDERKFVMCHEVLHVALEHHLRRGDRDSDRWNKACDYAINLMLTDAGIGKMPDGGLLNRGYAGMSAEQIYNLLPPSKEGGGSGNGNGFGEVRDKQDSSGNKLNKKDLAQASQQNKVAVQQAMSAAKAQGSMPSGVHRVVEELMVTQVDWREVLARFIDELSNNDYSWKRPNPRYQGVILPSLRTESIGNICFALDTSGSQSQEQIRAAVSESLEALATYEEAGRSPEITFIYCDRRIQGVEVLSAGDVPQPKGGGGTSFEPVMEYLQDNEVDATGLIYMTDGHCSRFGGDPGMPVLWMLTEKNENFDPPFGEVLTMEEQ